MAKAAQGLRARSLLYEAVRRFGFERGKTQSLGGFLGQVYDCERDGQPCILKIRPLTARRTLEYTMGELDFLKYLAEEGVRVPRPVVSLKGEIIEVLVSGQDEFLAYAYTRP